MTTLENFYTSSENLADAPGAAAITSPNVDHALPPIAVGLTSPDITDEQIHDAHVQQYEEYTVVVARRNAELSRWTGALLAQAESTGLVAELSIVARASRAGVAYQEGTAALAATSDRETGSEGQAAAMNMLHAQRKDSLEVFRTANIALAAAAVAAREGAQGLMHYNRAKAIDAAAEVSAKPLADNIVHRGLQKGSQEAAQRSSRSFKRWPADPNARTGLGSRL